MGTLSDTHKVLSIPDILQMASNTANVATETEIGRPEIVVLSDNSVMPIVTMATSPAVTTESVSVTTLESIQTSSIDNSHAQFVCSTNDQGHLLITEPGSGISITTIDEGNNIQSGENSGSYEQYSVTTANSVQTEGTPSTSTPITKELFLCGQCSVGFNSIEDCKAHMVEAHNIANTQEQQEQATECVTRVSVGTQVTQKKKPGRKKKNAQNVEKPASSDSDSDWNTTKEENDGRYEGRARRRRRPPKALKSDYYLGRKKKKDRMMHIIN